MPSRLRLARWSLAGVISASTLLAATLAPASAVAGELRPLPLGLAATPRTSSSGSSFTAVSCPSATSCVAVGQVRGRRGWVALIYSEGSAGWRTVTAPSPAGASAASPDNDLLAIDCVVVSSCVAVGSYANDLVGGTTGQQALIDVKAGGKWKAVAPPLPSNARTKSNNTLDAVSCFSAGNCVAVGSYIDTKGNQQALLDVETSGTWSSVGAPLPPGSNAANANNSLDAVTCTSATDCVAVGDYVATVSASPCAAHACQLSLLDVESAGVWSAHAVPLPSNATSSPTTGDLLSALACPATGECAAVGTYVDKKGNNRVLLDVESAGIWVAVTAPLPADASKAPNTNALLSVTCTSVGNCVAVGHYDNARTSPEGLIETDVSGVWSSTTAPIPSDARVGQPDVVLTSVSCVPTAGCVAVGTYVTSLGNLHPRALLDVQIGTVWSAGYVELPGDASGTQAYSALIDVVCSSATACVAVGLYETSKNLPAVLIGTWSIALTTIPVAPSAPTIPTALAGPAQARVSWIASASNGGSPITGYTVHASPGGAVCTTTGARSCTIRRLSGNVGYSFTVTAQNELGSSPPSSRTHSVLVPPALKVRATIDPFAPNSSALTSGLRAQVVALSKRIIPSGDTVIAIVGYSDIPAKPSTKPSKRPTKKPIVGLAVSRKRALAVDAFLRRQLGVLHLTGVTISISERGSANPVASNRTPRGRARNRRVVVTLH